MFATAKEHFDPRGTHLPEQSTGAVGNADAIGIRLGWTKHAIDDFAFNLGRDIGSGSCTEQTIPGTSEQVWVVETNSSDDTMAPDLGVVYERADGSLVGVAVRRLYGNNSLEPVSWVDIDREDAFGFVTDPGLRVPLGEGDGEIPATRSSR